MFALVVRFELRPESVDAFDDLVARTLDGIREEPGTLLYVTSGVADAPLSRVFVEVYADDNAFAAHEQYPHTQRFLEEREAMVESYRVEFLDPGAGKLPDDWPGAVDRG
jgi:quinol monooxygenase YgiN